jgi:acyl-CoA dehydrogenase
MLSHEGPVAATAVAGDSGDRVQAVRELTRLITSSYDRRYFVGCIEADRYPVELLEALAASDLLGIGVPVEQGGIGGGLREEVALAETICRAGIVPTFMAVPSFARIPVINYGAGELAEEFVAASLRPNGRPCFAITEPNAGTNVFETRTKGVRDHSGWRIDGQKVFISGADKADHMLLVARTEAHDSVRKTDGLTLFIVDMKADGITLQAQRVHATAPCKPSTVFLDSVCVPEMAVVGEPGNAFRYLFDILNPERIITAAIALGLGEFILEKGIDYARQRAPFSQPIGSYQSIQHPFSRAKVYLEAARVMLQQAAEIYDTGGDARPLANMVKYVASEAASAAADATIQAHGGYAFDEDYDLMGICSFLRLLQIAPLNNEMILNFVGETLLDLPRSY